jgi:hypothetical protein
MQSRKDTFDDYYSEVRFALKRVIQIASSAALGFVILTQKEFCSTGSRLEGLDQ